MPSTSTPSLLASTTPPSPPCGPPRAVSSPSMLVDCVLSVVTIPPLPPPVPLAETVAPASTTTRRAVRAGMATDPPLPSAACRPACARASVVPSATVPPGPPLAVTTAPSATRTVSVALTATVPPAAPAAPSAPTRPSTRTEPPTPAMSIRPARPATVFARIVPPARTKSCTIPSAARAVICTDPPSAITVPVFVTSAVTALPSRPNGACVTARVTSIDTSPSP